MSGAYVDTSAFLAAALGDSGHGQVAAPRGAYSTLLSSNLLEAEARAAFAREGLAFDAGILGGIEWVTPDRPLSQELETAAAAGYLRGAHLWHVAMALYVATDPGELAFIALDARQQAAALALGFKT